MKLDYGTQLSPEPITLSVGTIRKPTLRDIAKITFARFGYYEFLLKLNPELYYTNMKGNDGKEYWETLTAEEQEAIELYALIESEEELQKQFVMVFNFFFIENVVFQEGYFIILKNTVESFEEITDISSIRGVISKDTFQQVIGILQQICCIYDDEEMPSESEFKNKLAQKMFEKMLQAKKKQNKKKRVDKNLTLPNIISSVSSKHNSLNIINIWDLTVFQLLDSFNRISNDCAYDISALRVAVWGDEKKTFDSSLWHKNNYDKK